MSPRPLPWNGIAIGYFCLVIALLTLNPFRFQAYDPSQFWQWNIRPSDVLQNILLFIPLGILLRHGIQLPHRICLILGLLLSGAVESAQLLIAERTSNVLDLISNAAGAYLGSRFVVSLGLESHREARVQGDDSGGGWRRHRATPQLPLALMLLPLCWIRAIVAEGQPNSEWLILPNAIAGLALLRALQVAGDPHRATPYAWLLLAVIPAAGHRGDLCLAVAGSAIAIEHFAFKSRLLSQHLVLGLLCLGLGISLYVDGLWMKQLAGYAGEGWYKLRWIEILLSAEVAIYAWLGRHGNSPGASAPE